MKNTLRITTPSDREIVMTRDFNAPRHLVYHAMTTPELVRRWLGVFGGWSLDVCEIDLRVSGKYRYVWHRASGGTRMEMSGEYLEIVPTKRLVTNEKFDDPWYEGQAICTAALTEENGITTLSTIVQYDTKEIRDAVLASPMESGVSASYDKLEDLLAETAKQL
jgi:uncharacterized protein YndB with AHSA1/START domain